MRIIGDRDVDASRLLAIEQAVRTHRITEHVLRDLDRLDATFETLIEQDEFSHDLVIGLSDGLFLVYDTT